MAEINRYARIAPDFGSSSRRSKGSILSICAFWCNAKDGLKKQVRRGGLIYLFPRPYTSFQAALQESGSLRKQ